VGATAPSRVPSTTSGCTRSPSAGGALCSAVRLQQPPVWGGRRSPGFQKLSQKKARRINSGDCGPGSVTAFPSVYAFRAARVSKRFPGILQVSLKSAPPASNRDFPRHGRMRSVLRSRCSKQTVREAASGERQSNTNFLIGVHGRLIMFLPRLRLPHNPRGDLLERFRRESLFNPRVLRYRARLGVLEQMIQAR